MANENVDKPKRKRGRPPKKKAVLPEFKSENDVREYILRCSLELALESKEVAQKKNNIKKPQVANEILKDLQLNKLEEKVQLMEEGLLASVNNNKTSEEPSEETLEKIEKLTELTEQLAELKE